jgi:hypothetical protein
MILNAAGHSETARYLKMQTTRAHTHVPNTTLTDTHSLDPYMYDNMLDCHVKP